MREPDIDDNELDDEASRKFHEALASGKAKVRLKTMPTTTTIDLAARIASAKKQLLSEQLNNHPALPETAVNIESKEEVKNDTHDYSLGRTIVIHWVKKVFK